MGVPHLKVSNEEHPEGPRRAIWLGGGLGRWCCIAPQGRCSRRLEGGTCSNAIQRRRAA
jgi:hypothetical protein